MTNLNSNQEFVMFHLTPESVSDDNLDKNCHSFGIISNIDNQMISSLYAINLAISYAKQGFKTLLLDLNLSQPMIGLLLCNKLSCSITTNKLLDKVLAVDEVGHQGFVTAFPSEGSLTIIPANIDMKSRMKIQDVTNTNSKKNLIVLMDLIKVFKEKFNLIVLNMPNGSDLRQLTQSCLVSDYNFLLIDQNNVSIGYGIDLVTNLEAIHPLIEFKGLLLYDYQYNVNFTEDERPLIEQTFGLPIIATLPKLSSYDIINYSDDSKPDIKLENYYKFFSQELYKFILNPTMYSRIQGEEKELIEVLIIANQAGIPLFTSYLKELPNSESTVISQDEILASATLTAVVTGITEVIKELTEDLSGETKLIKQKHINLVIEYDKPLRAIMLTQKNDDTIRNKLILFLKLFKKKYQEVTVVEPKKYSEAHFLVKEVF